MAVLFCVAGWLVSADLLRVSAGGAAADSPFLRAVCGGDGEGDGCKSVLTSPSAYFRIGSAPNSPRIPVSALGMAYFACAGLWYLFIGSPTRERRHWHVLILVLVIAGAFSSLSYVRLMAFVLHEWCGGCVAAHVLNGGLLLVTLLAWPWRAAKRPSAPHPGLRLVLATSTVGVLASFLHLFAVYLMIASSYVTRIEQRYKDVVQDSAYVQWNFGRQPIVDLKLSDDEHCTGAPEAPHTAVVFSDFQCTHCKTLHDLLAEILDRHPGRLRIAYRYYPQDPACNDNPDYVAGAHASACRAAAAVEAARVLGGPEAYERMRDTLFARQAQIPKRPPPQQTQAERELFADWAAELGLCRAAMLEAMDAPLVQERIQRDIALAHELGLKAMPAVFLDGRRLAHGWQMRSTWDALLAEDEASAEVTPPTPPAGDSAD